MAGDILGRKNLEGLQSYLQYYKMFENGLTTCEGDSWPTQTKVTLGENPNLKEYENQIVRALCYIKNMRRGQLTNNNKFCDFFYFWVGNIFWKKFKGNTTSFKEAMEKVKGAMSHGGTDHGCSFRFKTEGMTFFPHWKRVYDYLTDRTLIGETLGSGDHPCTETYHIYLQAIRSAYRTVRAQCIQSGNNDTFCEEMKKVNGGDDFGSVPNLNCTVVSEIEAAALYSSKSGTSSALSGAISSGSVFLGIPTILFFLYKYNLLPNWINNTLFKKNNGSRSVKSNRRNGRHKRESTIRNHFDNLTDTSTEYSSADNSTLGVTDRDTSTVLSVPYIR
ncbi:KIR-like protein [Plasmodium knowlesi strain H]|uniref:KIR-like protein n=3 Tax=Plasmodium knowlesi TaxID=5850 RepID=A0A5K1VNK8_PLAKH|nr:KIR-like protein [Plasmodium knowlesi strain H]OTN68333.1 KIR-like protein [Plasmodium knowlesi]CAA9987237.1 KIR-like protein [Plasmodium knowlesi strain H]SBO24007.1 KIR-like protein [Plasmodium knowlesi strain H]SBO26003.1 KIR-like protein [Plasmodium knowlesi strain H]VVS76711.1 KIR-like protein [Plasmodium knowlesi strain H]|eukprot:XP_002261858.1 kir-like protein [Plasmodium knowlesi strain H]